MSSLRPEQSQIAFSGPSSGLERITDFDFREQADQIVGIHEASGVSLEPHPDLRALGVVTYHEVSDYFEDPEMIRIADQLGRTRHLIPTKDIPELRQYVFEGDLPPDELASGVFTAKDRETVAAAELLIGPVFIRRLEEGANDPTRASYKIYADFGGVIHGGRDGDASYSELFLNITPTDVMDGEGVKLSDAAESQKNSKDYYVIQGATESRLVSQSTLAILDAALQMAELTSSMEFPPEGIELAAVLGNVYSFNYFGAKNPLIAQGFFETIVERWSSEMGVAEPSSPFMEDLGFYDSLQIRQVNLLALKQEFGAVKQVIKIDPEVVAGNVRPASASGKELTVTGTDNELLERFSPNEKQGIAEYTRQLVTLLQEALQGEEDYTAGLAIDLLVESGMIAHDLAQVHAPELEALMSEYLVLLSARESMEAAGVDAGAITTAMEAKLVGFVIRNNESMQRTRQLAPELGLNLERLIEIIERTKLKGRSITEITSTIGRFVMAQETVVQAAFPELIKVLRRNVTAMGIELFTNEWGVDRTGTTLVIPSADGARVEEYISGLFKDAGISQDSIPINVDAGAKLTRIKIGTRTQAESIPEEQYLPPGPEFVSKTRGH